MKLSRLLLVVALCTLATGCLSPVRRPVVRLDPRPHLVHFPGIGGEAWFHREFVRALGAGGFDASLDVIDWPDGRFPIAALQSEAENRRRAEAIAAEIATRARAGAPIYFTSESGGAGMAVWVLESLPDDVSVESLIMLGPALSPQYDLSVALRHVRGSAHAFSSRYDKWILSLGTSVFGTMDGVHTPAAGCVGFTMPPGADAAQYEKLVRHEYQVSWLWDYGRHGGHTGVLSVRFASGYIAPLLIETAQRSAAETL